MEGFAHNLLSLTPLTPLHRAWLAFSLPRTNPWSQLFQHLPIPLFEACHSVMNRFDEDVCRNDDGKSRISVGGVVTPSTSQVHYLVINQSGPNQLFLPAALFAVLSGFGLPGCLFTIERKSRFCLLGGREKQENKLVIRDSTLGGATQIAHNYLCKITS